MQFKLTNKMQVYRILWWSYLKIVTPGSSSTYTGHFLFFCTLITSIFLQTIKLLCLDAIEHPKENSKIAQYKWRLSEKEKVSCQFTAVVIVLWISQTGKILWLFRMLAASGAIFEGIMWVSRYSWWHRFPFHV